MVPTLLRDVCLTGADENNRDWDRLRIHVKIRNNGNDWILSFEDYKEPGA